MNTTRSDTLRALALTLALLLPLVATGSEPQHVHETFDCGGCHQAGASSALRTETSCRGCHGPASTTPWGSPAFHGEATSECATCHVFHDPTVLRLPGNDEPVALADLSRADTNDMPVECTPCHRDGADLATLTPAHRAAADWYHATIGEVTGQSISASCLRCHDAAQPLPDELDAGWDPPRPHVEASHPNEVRITANRRGGFGIRRTIDPRLQLVDERVECTTCHDVFVDENDMLVAFASRQDLCLGCHVRTGPEELALAR